jgi:tape measure domain-containing protein
MAKSVSISITARDNFSSAITSMRNSTQAFRTDLTGVQSKLDALNKNKVTLKIDTLKAKAALKEAEEQFKKTGSAADKMALMVANADYENARRNLELLSKNAKQAEKDILNMTSAISKADNRAGGGGGGGSSSFLSKLAVSGASSYLGNVASQIANTYIGSAYGNEVGTYFGSALSGAGMGAAIGSAIAPGIGTAVGAALGTVVGLVQGAVKVFEKQDEGFKEYYKAQYDTVIQAQKDALESGTGIAANREQKMIAFATLLGGEDAARSYLGEMTAFASKTPFSYDELANISKTLLAYGYQQKEILPLLTSIGDAGSALGLGGEDMAYMASYLGRMRTTGKTTMEYLNPLLERGIDVYKAIAKMPEAAGKTNEQIQEMVSKGLIPGGEAAQAIAQYMGDTYTGNMAKQAETFGGLTSTLADAQANLNNAMGEGYNDTKIIELEEQTAWMEDNATALEMWNYEMGQYQAALEGEQARLKRDVISSLLSGRVVDSITDSTDRDQVQGLITKYKLAQTALYEAEKSGNTSAAAAAQADLIEVKALAEAMAQSFYNSSELGQIYQDSQLSLVEELRNNASVNDAYYSFGYEMGVQFSKGMVKAVDDMYASTFVNGAEGGFKGTFTMPAYAYGMPYVPYDNFPAILHEGERVLTASENRGYGSGVTVKVSGNSFAIREEADVDKVAQKLAKEISRAMALSVE